MNVHIERKKNLFKHIYMKNAASVCRDVTVLKGHTFFFLPHSTPILHNEGRCEKKKNA